MARYVFNPPQAPILTDVGTTTYLYANEPTVILNEGGEVRRNETQTRLLPERLLPEPLELFGGDLGWAFRRYTVTTSQPALSGSDLPPRPVAARELEVGALGMASELYLFNVIVALEWLPSRATLDRLEWAFRRASDFLYDVTNGCMAFGQVVFADRAWMACADIQIMASNRFLPRSWVSGLLDPVKYTPIRVGRGLWVRDRQAAVPWDEPEGYRTLVHEWSHYALGLKDEYLSPVPFVDAGSLLLNVKKGNRVPSDPVIVIPTRRIMSEGIMATAEGNSELLPLTLEPSYISVDGRGVDDYYPVLARRLKQRIAGPSRLPLPLPVFHCVGDIAADAANANERSVKLAVVGAAIPANDDGSPVEGTALYLVRGALADPVQIVSQGELTATALKKDGAVELLGVEKGDIAVLIGNASGQTTIWMGEFDGREVIELTEQAATAGPVLSGGSAASPFGSVDVLPDKANEKDGSKPVTVKVQREEGAAAAAAGSGTQPSVAAAAAGNAVSHDPVVFSLYGDRVDVAADGMATLPSLDGYVLTSKGGSWMISDFSKGGPPNTAPNMVSDFVAAGAASGDAVLFFDDPDVRKSIKQAADDQAAGGAPEQLTAQRIDNARAAMASVGNKYDDIQVVVTTLRGVKLPGGFTAVSPVYSVASTGLLPEDTNPTLLIVNPLRGLGEAASLRICRLDGPDVATVLPTFFANGATFAATPLAAATPTQALPPGIEAPADNGKPHVGGTLLKHPLAEGEERVERYVLADVAALQPPQQQGASSA